MNRKRHYLQLFLSVFVLILPSLLVAWLGWTNIGRAHFSHGLQRAITCTSIPIPGEFSTEQRFGAFADVSADGERFVFALSAPTSTGK